MGPVILPTHRKPHTRSLHECLWLWTEVLGHELGDPKGAGGKGRRNSLVLKELGVEGPQKVDVMGCRGMEGNRGELEGWTHTSDPQSPGQSTHKGDPFRTQMGALSWES